MSSYQFVNSLASCYANQQQSRSGASPVDPAAHQQHQAATPGADYYNPNAVAASAYPPSCYSPPQVTGHHYPQHPYAAPATAAAGAHTMQPSGMVDYTQLQPQRLSGSAANHLHHASPAGAQSPGLLAPQPNNPNNASCKYADSTSSTSVASPQDLSTTGGVPTRSSPPLSSQPPSANSSNATVTSKTSGLTSPLSVSTSPPGKQPIASSTASQNLSSPASSTSSTSSSERTANSNNNSKSGQSSNPPQIYPWMKRVHLGQSKSSNNIILTLIASIKSNPNHIT